MVVNGSVSKCQKTNLLQLFFSRNDEVWHTFHQNDKNASEKRAVCFTFTGVGSRRLTGKPTMPNQHFKKKDPISELASCSPRCPPPPHPSKYTSKAGPTWALTFDSEALSVSKQNRPNWCSALPEKKGNNLSWWIAAIEQSALRLWRQTVAVCICWSKVDTSLVVVVVVSLRPLGIQSERLGTLLRLASWFLGLN